ncbi:MAG TPA: phage major capsid protein [Solirubrobacterales bacterium]|nr:phage major capsid protein [Solirubrobacterales bacterium]
MDKVKLKELRGQIGERRAKLKEVFDQAGDDMDMSKVTVIEGDSAAKVETIRTMNTELDELVKEAEPLEAEAATLERGRREAEQYAAERQGHPLPPRGEGLGAPAMQSLGDLIFESGAHGEFKDRTVELEDLDVNATLFETGAGWEPEVVRTGRLVEKAVRPIQIIDVIPGGATGETAVKYMEEVTFTNAAKEIGEGDEYPEAALKLVEKESPVKKIAVFLPVTDEQFEDVPQVKGYIDRRLPFMLRQRLDGQIPNGDGVEDNLLGFLNKEGLQTQAKGADPVPDAIYKAGTKIETTGQAVRGPVLINPVDWQDVRLLRTADGIYIWGNPSEAGPERIWGQQVVKAQAMPEGTALIGDFANFSELAFRTGIELKVSDSHADFFVKGKQAIRARVRAALVIYRPAAFCSVTGI